MSIRTPGAGGYGDPTARSKAAIERDLRTEKLSIEQARDAYGDAVIDEITGSDTESVSDSGQSDE